MGKPITPLMVLSSASLITVSLFTASLVGCGYSSFLSHTLEQELRISEESRPLPVGFDRPISQEGPARGAFLVQGTAPVRGLPGFGRNAIPSLSGTYYIRSHDSSRSVTIKVWASWEMLYFKPSRWAKTELPTPNVARAWSQMVDETSYIPALLPYTAAYNLNQARIRAFELAIPGPQSSQWTLFVLEQADTAEDRILFEQFYKKFTERFIYFLGTARRVEDVSLPALLLW